MKFGYTILYVENVERTLAFYERAFGLRGKLLQPDAYAELDTGDTKLAFAAKAHVRKHFPITFQEAGATTEPPPVELALVTDDVQHAYEQAVGVGAVAVAAPAPKPWGQIVAYVRDDNGFLIELCTPLG